MCLGIYIELEFIFLYNSEMSTYEKEYLCHCFANRREV